MKQIKHITYIIIAVMTIMSCSKEDDWTDDEKVDTSFMLQTRCSDVASYLKSTYRLRILAIGNSYTDDYTTLLDTIMKKSGCDMNNLAMYELVRGGGSFKTWYDCSMGKDTASYSAVKIFDNTGLNLPVGECGANDSTLLSTYMQKRWDIILIQQASQYATDYSSWFKKSDSGYLSQWAAYINKHQPNALFGFFLIHSYASSYAGNGEHSHIWRWQNIANSVKQLQTEYPLFQIIIPCGTAIENLRGSELNDDYDFTRDGTHLGYGLARFVAGACLYHTLFYPHTNKHLEGIDFRGGVRQWEMEDSTSYPYITVTEDNIKIARNSAIDATDYPYNVGVEK